MERPKKRMKITDPDIRNPRGPGSRRTEGLFTTELGMRSDETDRHVPPTRTISLDDFQRQKVFSNYHREAGPVLRRRNAGIHLLPRAPAATVTASVVQVNVNDGTSVSVVTQVPVATTVAVVSLTDVGALTTAVSVTIPPVSNSTIATGGATGSVATTSRSTTLPNTSTITSLTSSSSSTLPPISGNSNGTITPSRSDDGTVTVTATSTFEVSLINGTLLVTEPAFVASATPTGATVISTGGSGGTKTYTFGEFSTTLTDSSGSFTTGTASVSSATSSDSFPPGAGATGSPSITSGGAAATSGSGSASGGGGGNSNSLSPVQQQVVGGVIGGVAGIALVLLIVLYVLRFYRRRLKERGELPEQLAAREVTEGGPGEAYPMSQRSSTTPLTAVVAYGLKRLRPHSSQTLRTTATATTEASVPVSERGFQRIAGRKLDSVIGAGGDPYGGNFGAFEKDAGVGPVDLPERGLSGASFYQDNRGFYGGKGTGTGTQTPQMPSSPITAISAAQTGEMSTVTGTASSARDFAAARPVSVRNGSQLSLATPSQPEGFAVMRPSPARTPVTLSPSPSSIRLPIQQPLTMDERAPPLPVPLLRDAVGRSLASLDGSRVSRSSGRSGGRFVENV